MKVKQRKEAGTTSWTIWVWLGEQCTKTPRWTRALTIHADYWYSALRTAKRIAHEEFDHYDDTLYDNIRLLPAERSAPKKPPRWLSGI